MPAAVTPWLLRIPPAFPGAPQAVLDRLGVTGCTALGGEYILLRHADPEALRRSDAWIFVPWNLRVEHSWPCVPRTTESFVEKAAQALARKFAARGPQAILTGSLEPGSPDKYYRSLASNLRGRLLQVFPPLSAASPEDQDPERPLDVLPDWKGRVVCRHDESAGSRRISCGRHAIHSSGS